MKVQKISGYQYKFSYYFLENDIDALNYRTYKQKIRYETNTGFFYDRNLINYSITSESAFLNINRAVMPPNVFANASKTSPLRLGIKFS